ncbi:MAG: cysteine--tRNA ligase [Candidatus Marinimicrobia bacterium]|nr:cysteine--tRNA ligase [Candidatus Neomarinimicrobiota bacterium]RPG05261.1 MAG: cysteine--tRNA ligase [Pelagibacteraceae bacterium TMED247]
MNKKLNIFNTQTGKKENFIPINENKIGMYVCGPTVYDFPHIGNARPLVVFDVLFRLLSKVFGTSKVTYVRNITDIDDKIIETAKKKKISIDNLTSSITKSFNEDCKYLNCLKPSFEPKATEHIKGMIAMTENLLRNKHAYEKDKHVYFSVNSFTKYGKLSKKNLDELVAGARVEVSKLKKDPLDFVLWKPSSSDDPGWDSPWGRGRPGWHLECSVMSEKFLGKNFDIHGGGLDLVFPHHENEIAQSCCANKVDKFANYWLHNGYVTFNKEKMSKSLGNIVTINKMRETINGQVIRLALLSTHYKQPLDWNENLIKESQNTLDKWYTQFENLTEDDLTENLLQPLLEDINTPGYISKLHSLYEKASKGDSSSKKLFVAGCNLIGLLEDNLETWKKFKKAKSKIDENIIKNKIKDRENARKKGDYKLADNIRKDLESGGVIIEDKGEETTWRYK